MDKLILNDFTEINIQDGSGLNDIKTMLPDYSSFLTFAEKFTEQNLSHVMFQSNNEKSAEYYSMVLMEPNFIITKINTGVEVSFGLREQTQEELQRKSVETAISYLSDELALTVKDLYANWETDPVGYEYSMDNPLDLRRNYKSGLWKLKKSHEKQADWYPGADPTLWEQIIEGHAGTLEDPIPVPDSVTTSGFTYVYGKYYKEGEEIYLAKREGKNDGEEETLYFAPSSLVGQYFELQ